MRHSLSPGGIRLGLSLLTLAERRYAVLLAVSIIINSLLQTVALAGVLPFVQSLIAPDAAMQSGWAVWLQEAGIALPASLSVIGSCLLLLVLAKNVYTGLQTRWQARFSASCEQRLASDLLRQFLEASYAWNIRQNTSVVRDIIRTHVVQWSRGFLRSSLQLANDVLFAVMAVSFLIYVSPKIGGLIFCITSFIAWVLMRLLRPHLLAKAKAKREANYRSGIFCNEALAGVRDVKMTGSQALFVRTFADEFSRYSFADSDYQVLSSLPRLLLEVLGYGALIGTALLITWSEGDTSEAASLLALYGVAGIRLLAVFNGIIGNLHKLLDALPLIEDIHSLEREAAAGEGAPAAGDDPFTDWTDIQFTNIGYRYAASDRFALSGITTTIVRGESVGVVGPSGAGKSTLADVLSALLEPTEGVLTVGGQPVHGPARFAWRGHIGYVSQNPFILDASLRDNIVFGHPTFDTERLDMAIKAAHLGPVVAQLPAGLDTPLGERGMRLSGGQRQRVAIARALYRNADLLILDEATSALDTLSEQEITEAITGLVGSVTVVVIAHRLATVKHCTRVLVMVNGRVIDSGGHEELMRSCPIYRDMVRRSAPVSGGGVPT